MIGNTCSNFKLEYYYIVMTKTVVCRYLLDKYYLIENLNYNNYY